MTVYTKQSVDNKVWDIVLFFLLFQPIWSPFLIFGAINLICVTLSKLIAICVILIYISKCMDGSVRSFKPFGYMSLIFVSLLISTIIGYGDIRRFFSMVYCPLGLLALFQIKCQNLKSSRFFIHSLSLLFYSLCLIEFIFVLCFPQGINYNNKYLYFLGGENLLGFSLLCGLLIVLIDYYLKGCSKKYMLSYIIMEVVTILIIFSGGNVSGTTITLLLLLPLTRQILRTPFIYIVLFFIGAFVFLIVFNHLQSVLNDSYVQYIVMDVLGKNLTLTNRTDIWGIAINGFFKNPIWGYGIRESTNLFYLARSHNEFSAHNQFLQSLYEGGIMFYVSLAPLLLYTSHLLNHTKHFGFFIKAVTIGLMTMYMSEASGLTFMLFIITIACSIAPILKSNLKHT